MKFGTYKSPYIDEKRWVDKMSYSDKLQDINILIYEILYAEKSNSSVLYSL